MGLSYRCKICGNPEVNKNISGDNPNKQVCDWTCASILNKKLIIISAIIGLFGLIGSFIVFPIFLIIFIPFSIFAFYSLNLIITGREQKRLDRIKFVGEEDEDALNFYIR